MPADQTADLRVTPVRAAFCSSRDHRGRVIFDGEYFSYLWWRWHSFGDTDAQDDFYRALRDKQAAGVTHVVLDCPNGDPYAGGHNWITELPKWVGADGMLDPQFMAMAAEMLTYFHGIFFAYGGGQVDAPNIYNGNLGRMIRQMVSAGFGRRCLYGHAWEPCGRNPEMTTRQNYDAVGVMADALGDGAAIFLHVNSSMPQRFTPASYPVEPDDPTKGDEIGAWYTGHFLKVTHWLGQLGADDAGPTSGQEPRLIEGMDRFFATGTPFPLVGTAPYRRDPDEHGHYNDTPASIGPDWFTAQRRVVYVIFEPGVPWGYIRGTVTDETVANLDRDYAHLGLLSRGCLPVPVTA